MLFILQELGLLPHHPLLESRVVDHMRVVQRPLRAHLIAGYIFSLRVETTGRDPLAIDAHKFVVLARPAIVVDQKEGSILFSCLYLEFDRGLAPNELCVEDVEFLTRFHISGHSVPIDPLLVIRNSLVKSDFHVAVLLSFALNNQFDGPVDHFVCLLGPLADLLATVGAGAAAQKAFTDAFVAEGVPAHSRAT